mmetsp:Transcript_1147/g.1384  ORF Transcript_1147/g.1384 Transcript_1147/m.1384 type:complete len:125 (-) Transcript_1147:93-467(-)
MPSRSSPALRHVTNTCAPHSYALLTISKPRPRFPPVTTTFLSFKYDPSNTDSISKYRLSFISFAFANRACWSAIEYDDDIFKIFLELCIPFLVATGIEGRRDQTLRLNSIKQTLQNICSIYLAL